MTLSEAIAILDKARHDVNYSPEGEPLWDWHQALDMALGYLREREAFWAQQKANFDKGGHWPGSDF